MNNSPRILIAGTHSGVGKTTLSTAIMAVLKKRGYIIQPYKVGPDYIDPGYHFAATGRVSRNLDCWMLGEETVKEVFKRSSGDADIAVIEGVMGLYDGLGSTSVSSSAHVAKILNAPVLLVLDVRSMARSSAAIVLGYMKIDPQVKIAGVILNKVGSLRHYKILKESIEDVCGVPVLGFVPREKSIVLPERHLGLLPTAENDGLFKHIESITEAVETGVDIKKIVSLARLSDNCPEPVSNVFPEKYCEKKAKIGIFRDTAFNFYYQDSLDLLELHGGEIVDLSPLENVCLPADIGGLYIGGGFPEMFLKELSQNNSFIKDVKRAADSGMPIYAECGGLMYLVSHVTGFEGRSYEVTGILPGSCRMDNKRAGLGYVTAKAYTDNILCRKGEMIRGHEFHYSVFERGKNCWPAYELKKWGDETPRLDGASSGNIMASYVHLHFAGCDQAAVNFVQTCTNFKKLSCNTR